MSHIHSPVADVKALEFHAMPSKKAVAMTAGVRVGNVHVFLDAKGKVYSTQVKARSAYTLGCGLDDTLAGCRALGLLGADAVKKHAEAMRLSKSKRSRKYAADSFLDSAKELGVKLTAAQLQAAADAKAPA